MDASFVLLLIFDVLLIFALPYIGSLFNESKNEEIKSQVFSGDFVPADEFEKKWVVRCFSGNFESKYNDRVTIENIPEEVFQYIVNDRNPLAWMADKYQYSVDREAGIINDPNEYTGPKYIFDFVLRRITVSVETVKIVNSVPKLDFLQKQN